MDQSPANSSDPRPDIPRIGPKHRIMVRAGRLAGGAVVSVWLLSAMYHAALFGIMYLVPWLSGLSQDATPAPAPFTAIVGDVDQPPVSLTRSAPVETSEFVERVKPLQFAPKDFQPVPKAAPAQSTGLNILGIGTAGGDLDKFGFSVSSGSGGPEFFGLGGQARGARRIVYVVDRSGSMLTTIDGVKKELRQSIGKLRRSQKFHVIFFNAGSPLENPPKRLVSAIQANKRSAYRFVDGIAAGGGTDPRLALRRAFAVDPDLIYFLTDGEFDPKIVTLLSALNRNRRVRIFTIAYVSRTGAPLLERIAREHNGEYRFVSEDEIF